MLHLRTAGWPAAFIEVEGAKDCAVEICSFSKIAGFTGTRCGYTVVPQDLERDGQSLNKLWLRRQTTKFNGVAYVVQRGAEAVFTEEGMNEIQHNLDYYRQNAEVIAAHWTSAACGTAAARTAPTSGCAAPTAWAAGSSSTGCWRTAASSAPPAWASASAARATSA